MAEHRQKTHSILLRTEGKNYSLELFDSREWPEENGGEGLFRVRIDDVWHCPTGKYSFLTWSAVGELVAALLDTGEGDGLPPEEPAPFLPVKADVSVYLDGSLKNETGSVRTEPYQKRDGRWYCQVWVFGRGALEFCCNDVTLRRVRR